jgi:uncharacterized protein (TIGR02466 family)
MAEIDMESVETVTAFAVPIWISHIKNFKKMKSGIIKELNEVRKRDPNGAHKSNYVGYQTEENVNGMPQMKPVYDHIMESMVRKAINDLAMQTSSGNLDYAWANFNDSMNAFNAPHLHDGVFSGIFYVSAPEGSGDLVFMNDGHNSIWAGDKLRDKKVNSRAYAPTFVIQPKDGMCIIWASYMRHYVNPNLKQVERISIAFNITVQ